MQNEYAASALGEVKIADDVVSMIASLATNEIEGVSSLVGNITNDLMSKVGMKNLAKGAKVEVNGKKVIVDVSIIVEYGYNIPFTCGKVQEKVKNAIENMTGLQVVDVNVRIVGINMPKEK